MRDEVPVILEEYGVLPSNVYGYERLVAIVRYGDEEPVCEIGYWTKDRKHRFSGIVLTLDELYEILETIKRLK